MSINYLGVHFAKRKHDFKINTISKDHPETFEVLGKHFIGDLKVSCVHVLVHGQ